MGHSYNGQERRKDLRFPKNYSLFFYLKDSPDKKSDATFIKDISKGGVRFTTSHAIKEGTLLVFEISISYIAPRRLVVEGMVVLCKETIPRLVYEIRAKFNSVDAEAAQMFDMIGKQKSKGS